MAARLLLAVAAALVALAASGVRGIACPNHSRYNGCKKEGCIEVESSSFGRRGGLPLVVCDACGRGYTLVEGGTRRATCECAPGWAARGNNGICQPCPKDTDVAAGGSLTFSACLSCPEGTRPSDDHTECLCPAGHSWAIDPTQPAGTKHMACRPCAARNEYLDEDGHTLRTCFVCAAPLVANLNHTACVNASDPNAAPETSALASVPVLRGIANSNWGKMLLPGTAAKAPDAPAKPDAAAKAPAPAAAAAPAVPQQDASASPAAAPAKVNMVQVAQLFGTLAKLAGVTGRRLL